MLTYTGEQFDPLNPDMSKINVQDIARALSQQCRFAGHCHAFYSVAEHCIRGIEVAQARGAGREVIRFWLLHDASEAYLVDVPRPVKPYLRGYERIESQLMWLIWERFVGGPPTEAEAEEVKAIDNIMLAVERRDLMSPRGPAWSGLPEVGEQFPITNTLMPHLAEEAFLAALRRWGVE
jgi:hypothetical protein